MEDQVTEPREEVKAEEPAQEVKGALENFPDSPSKEQIESWKQEHGEVFCSGFSETELVIWRPVSRGEFVQLQTALQQAEEPVSQLDIETKVVQLCALWASGPAKMAMEKKAGSLSTLHEQIMMNSNFMDPRVAAALVVKL